MKTKTINLYTYDELSKEAQEKALSKWREHNDYFWLEGDMYNMLSEYLDEAGIKKLEDPKIYYSLSCCQGDGAMFEGSFEWNGYNVTVKQVGRYYHSSSKEVSITSDDGLGYYDNVGYKEVYDEFEKIYHDICKKLEKHGYDFIEYEDSEENFTQACEANGYTFRINGIMENE